MPTGTGQPRKEQDNKVRDVNKGDEEDMCNTRMKSMASRCSNTTHMHEGEHDATHDEEEDEDTTHAILIVDENEGKIENETQR